MNDILKIGSKLALICAVAAISLGLVNAVTEPKINQMREQKLMNALKKVAVGMEVGKYKEVPDNPVVKGYYPLNDNSGTQKGYIFNLVGIGYGGDLNIIAGVSTKGKILSVVMMNNQETPGLGKEAENPEYMKKYIGTGEDSPVPVRKSQLSQEDADAITGASITFMGIGKALEAASDFAKKEGAE